jgi:hypothetical protein
MCYLIELYIFQWTCSLAFDCRIIRHPKAERVEIRMICGWFLFERSSP